jgi:hypothetical protein
MERIKPVPKVRPRSSSPHPPLACPARVEAPQAFTVSLWFKTLSTLGARLISFGDSLPGAESHSTDRFLWLSDSGSLHFGVWDADSSKAVRAHILDAPGKWNDGSWHLATASVSASGMEIFLDGAKAAASAEIRSGGLDVYSGFWSLGHYVKNTSGWPPVPGGKYFRGSLAEPRILAAELPADWTRMDFSSQRPGAGVVEIR